MAPAQCQLHPGTDCADRSAAGHAFDRPAGAAHLARARVLYPGQSWLGPQDQSSELPKSSPGEKPRWPALHHLQVPHDAGGCRASEWRRMGQQGDPRVTSIGRLLRQYRLDELPQLINVLRGEMNIVGPRPERPTIVAELREHIAEYPLRQRARPGITGLAQINHHYDRSLEDVRTKVHYDLEYIRRQCVAKDLRIMLKTVPVILLRRGGW